MLTEAENRFFNLVRESVCKNRLAVLKSALERTAAGAAKKRRKDSEKWGLSLECSWIIVSYILYVYW